ncbi:PEP-CTERM sorting domain-containing protein, partial [Planctomycetota bacterium]
FDVLAASSIDANGLGLPDGYDAQIGSIFAPGLGEFQLLSLTYTPEPTTLSLLALGGLGLLARRRRTR